MRMSNDRQKTPKIITPAKECQSMYSTYVHRYVLFFLEAVCMYGKQF